MDYESLALDLEELRRRLQDVPGFPSRRDDGKLIDRVNEAARGLGVVERYLIEFRFKTYDVGPWASASVSVAQPDGPTCGDFYSVPIVREGGMQFHDWKSVAIPNRAKYAELLKRWAYHVRRLGVSEVGDRMPLPYLPTCGISEEAGALHELLADAAGVKLQGKTLVAKLAQRQPRVCVDEKRIVDLVKELRKAGIPVESRQGSPGYALPPRLASRNSRQIATE